MNPKSAFGELDHTGSGPDVGTQQGEVMICDKEIRIETFQHFGGPFKVYALGQFFGLIPDTAFGSMAVRACNQDNAYAGPSNQIRIY